MGLTEAQNNGASRVTHRGVLALHAGAVEAQGGNPLLGVLDVQDTLVASLSRLRLREVLGLQSDGLDHLYWYQDLVHSQKLGAVLGTQGMAQFGHAGNQKRQRLLQILHRCWPLLRPVPRGLCAHPQTAGKE